MLSVLNDFSILFVAVYMPGDMLINIDEFNFVLSSIHALQQLYLPDHVIYGGVWNADFSRSHSQHTIALQFCVEAHLIHVLFCSRKKSVEYTYLSDINCSKSLIDHFFISAQLDNCVNKLCVINDIENQSDYLPLCMSFTLPVCDIESNSTRRFVSKPKWFMADADILQRYKSEPD